MNMHKLSIKALKRELKKNGDITEQEWNNIAQNNGYMSSFTLQAKEELFSFSELKNVCKNYFWKSKCKI